MKTSDPQAHGLEQAQARLARTRQALLAQMHRHAPQPPAGNAAPNDGLWQVLRRWWQDHPAQGVLALAVPALQACANVYPVRTIALATGLGAAMVLLRPWRLLPLSALAMAAVRAIPLTDLLKAWRTQAEHRQSAAAGQVQRPAA